MSSTAAPRTGKLGLFAATALVIGNMIGSGVYLLPASLAQYGWNAIGGWLVTIGGSLVLAWVIACLTRQVPGSLDMVGFVTKAFGRFAGFLMGWVYLTTIWVGLAAVAMAAISYLTRLAPGISVVPCGPVFTALAVLWAIALVNLRGVQSAGNFQIVTTVIKVVPLVLVILIAGGLLIGGGADIAPFKAQDISFPAISGAATLTLWALLGFEAASAAAKQVRDPETNVPRATMWGTALTGLIYLLVCSAVALMLPEDIASTSPAPLAAFVERYWSAGPASLVAAFAVVSCIGALNGWTLLQGELPRNMATKGEFPRWFAITDARGTPRRALVFGTVISSAALLLNSNRSMQGLFEFLLLVTTSGALWFYLALALAAWRLKVARPFALIGAGYAVWTLWGAGLEADLWSLTLIVAGLPFYWWMMQERATDTVVRPAG